MLELTSTRNFFLQEFLLKSNVACAQTYQGLNSWASINVSVNMYSDGQAAAFALPDTGC